MPHPSGIFLKLRVVSPKDNSALKNFFGIHVYFKHGMKNQKKPSYMISSSSGNIRFNKNNDKLGDAILVLYPRQDFLTKRNLNY